MSYDNIFKMISYQILYYSIWKAKFGDAILLIKHLNFKNVCIKDNTLSEQNVECDFLEKNNSALNSIKIFNRIRAVTKRILCYVAFLKQHLLDSLNAQKPKNQHLINQGLFSLNMTSLLDSENTTNLRNNVIAKTMSSRHRYVTWPI